MTVLSTEKQAIKYLIEQASDETLRQVYELQQISPDWAINHHFGLGLWVRNTLREGGFTWDDLTLDSKWGPLIAAAAKRFVEG